MKAPRLAGPVWMWLATVAVLAWLARAGWRLRGENEALTAAEASSVAGPSSVASIAAEASSEAPAAGVTAEGLRAETAREIAVRTELEAKIAALEKRVPVGADEVLVSFGRIDEMGQRAAKAVSFLLTQAQPASASGAKPLAESPEAVKSFFTDFLNSKLQTPNAGRLSRRQ